MNHLSGFLLKAENWKRKAAIKRAQRKFTCKLHSEREQVQAHGVWLKLKTEFFL